jgi:hypothetical protein
LFEPNWFGEFGRRLEKARLAWVTLARGSLFSPLFWRDKKRFASRASPKTVDGAINSIFKRAFKQTKKGLIAKPDPLPASPLKKGEGRKATPIQTPAYQNLIAKHKAQTLCGQPFSLNFQDENTGKGWPQGLHTQLAARLTHTTD